MARRQYSSDAFAGVIIEVLFAPTKPGPLALHLFRMLRSAAWTNGCGKVWLRAAACLHAAAHLLHCEDVCGAMR